MSFYPMIAHTPPALRDDPDVCQYRVMYDALSYSPWYDEYADALVDHKNAVAVMKHNRLEKSHA